MPNHVTTRMAVRGPEAQVKAFEERCIKEDKDRDGKPFKHFDFNALIPKPAELDITSGTVADLGVALLSGNDKYFQKMLAYPWAVEEGIKTVAQMKARMIKQNPDAEKVGRQALSNLKKFGHKDWYSWSIANWGTKWNSYSFAAGPRRKGELVFSFDTAWGVPEPVLHQAAAEFPKLAFETVSFDEGWNFAARGGWSGGAGGVVDVDPTDEIYEEVYGEPPPKDED